MLTADTNVMPAKAPSAPMSREKLGLAICFSKTDNLGDKQTGTRNSIRRCHVTDGHHDVDYWIAYSFDGRLIDWNFDTDIVMIWEEIHIAYV